MAFHTSWENIDYSVSGVSITEYPVGGGTKLCLIPTSFFTTKQISARENIEMTSSNHKCSRGK